MSEDGTKVQDIQTDTAEWLRSERNKRDALAAHYERAGDEEVAQLHRSVVARYDFALAAVSRPAEAREYGTRMKSAYPEERAALAEEYAYAAECVRFVNAIRNGTAPMYDAEHHCWLVGGEFWAEGEEYANAFDAWAAHAAATREGTDNGV